LHICRNWTARREKNYPRRDTNTHAQAGAGCCTIVRYELELQQVFVNQLVAIAAGGALGALLRFWVASGVATWLGRGFPYGTLIVNVSGSLAMGFLYVLLLERFDGGLPWRAFLLVGLLGAFTTFSTFSIETVNLIEAGEGLKAVVNVVLSASLCVGAAAIGVVIGRQL
jgi:CrcB protein